MTALAEYVTRSIPLIATAVGTTAVLLRSARTHGVLDFLLGKEDA